jgi:hypothetical protein
MDNNMMIREARDSLFGRQTKYLCDKWSPYLEAIMEARREQGRPVDDMLLATTATCLENTARWMGRMDEATKAVNVGSFINHGFELITAVMPNLISNEIFSVQPMTRRTGEVFFMDILYGTTKGNITAGDTMFGSSASGNAGHNYSSESISKENIGTGDGGEVTFSGTLSSAPVKSSAGSLKLYTTVAAASLELGHTSGMDLSDNAEITAWSLNATTGAFSVTFDTAPDADAAITLDYSISFETNTDLIPEVNLQVTSTPVTAANRKLRAVYSLDASYDLEQAFGRSMDTELKSAVAMEIRQELDTFNLANVLAGAGSGDTSWDQTPDSGVSWNDHKWSFIDKALIPASNDIFASTRRAAGNFIVAGNNVCNIIESLAPRFKREGKTIPGPHYIGMLDHWRVYKNPHFNADTALVGYKGSMFLEAGYVFAPYMPIYTTRTAMLDDMMGRFGIATANGNLMVNNNFFSTISITSS